MNKDIIKDICVKAVKTFLQSILGVWTAGMLITDIDWKFTMTVALSAALYSIITNILLALDGYERKAGKNNGTSKERDKN